MPELLQPLLMVGAVIAIFYFLMIRPQAKRMKQQQEMQSSIEPGTRIMLTSGIFAEVMHVGDEQLVVSIAPGTQVTVVKAAIAKVVSADDEEFEFEDADAEVVVEPTAEQEAAAFGPASATGESKPLMTRHDDGAERQN